MSEFAIIVQNDESQWDDQKGDLYNYPRVYKNILTKGCQVVYFKGKLKNKTFATERLSPDPHYFDVAVIGDSIIDPDSSKQDRFCEILNYQEFEKAVSIKINGKYIEQIPASKQTNYWRSGVRAINKSTYDKIISLARIKGYSVSLPNENNEFESYGLTEGNKKVRYSSYYERNPFYRNKALEIHGLKCMACEFEFEKFYGDRGKGYIHVHHNKPISESGPTRINPAIDLSVLCANCHAMIHRNKKYTLSVVELKELIRNK